MSFFDMGMLEILLILVVALIIWGPKKIPEIARTLGKIVHTLRRATFDLTSTVTKELNTEEKDHPSPSGTNSDDTTKELPDVDTAESDNSEITSPRDP